MAADLRHIYQAATAQEAEQRLGEFEARWNDEYLVGPAKFISNQRPALI